ncbi:hypothetical protein MAC_03303 [Metarhizium acridum CQMa 102]|uniref:Uncharacterized protein n=1 Tax=Metarhizium acridum (strain CQMa 102) TaxID=655827 RepID=E9E027_METAQ|nr:uncharacterized protein MAC_03303 [Metarhizium acridum CQMa 102]EFY90723.1 hypothetical protein MAC_03303 [Metarhizium acridum CQMa 102]
MIPMENLSPENVEKRFSEDGFLAFEDAVLGDRVKSRSKVRFRPEDVDCLEFCKQNVFQDDRVQGVLGALFPWAALIWYEIYLRGPTNTEINAILTGQIRHMNAVVVQLCGPQSKVIIYKDSHLQPFHGAPGSAGLLEIAGAQVRKAGCEPAEIILQHGGLYVTVPIS